MDDIASITCDAHTDDTISYAYSHVVLNQLTPASALSPLHLSPESMYKSEHAPRLIIISLALRIAQHIIRLINFRHLRRSPALISNNTAIRMPLHAQLAVRFLDLVDGSGA